MSQNCARSVSDYVYLSRSPSFFLTTTNPQLVEVEKK